MSEFQEYASYGATGLFAFIIIKWILPLFQAVINKASTEATIYDNAKGWIDYTNAQLKSMQERYDALEKLYEAEKKERQRLERIVNGHD